MHRPTGAGEPAIRRRWRGLAAALAPALSVSLALVALFNWRFWSETSAAVGFASVADVLCAYSADTYGVRIHREMVRNLFATDQREVLALLSPRLALYLAGLGLIPALLVWRSNPRSAGFGRQLRALFILGASVLCAVLVCGFFSRYAEFAREHRDLRCLISPGNAIVGAIQYARASVPHTAGEVVMDDLGPSARLAHAAGTRSLLMFLVVGETARGQDFKLGGYERATKPQLAAMDVRNAVFRPKLDMLAPCRAPS